MPKLTMGRSRTPADPYLTIIDDRTGWIYKVLKAYSGDPDRQYARWFCDVQGFGHDMGDCYIADVSGTIAHRDPVVTDADLPAHLKGGKVAHPTADLFG